MEPLPLHSGVPLLESRQLPNPESAAESQIVYKLPSLGYFTKVSIKINNK